MSIWSNPNSELLQKKTHELFSGILNVFSITDAILIVGFDELGRYHNATLDKVLRIYRQANLKLNKDKCLFRFTGIPFFGEAISKHGVSLDPSKVQALTDMPPPQSKNELKSFLGILNYLSKFSPAKAEVCKPLPKMISVKIEWAWNKMYQDLYDRTMRLIKKDTCMKFYDASRSIYLENDA